MAPIFSDEQHELLKRVQSVAEKTGMPLFLVGGVLRDALLETDITDKDFDFVVEGDPYSFAEQCAGELGGKVKSFKNFLTAKLVAPAAFKTISEIDIASSRSEHYLSPGSLPEVTKATLQEDLKRRDFTINAMAIKVSDLIKCVEGSVLNVNVLYSCIVDQFNGRADLERKLVRILHPKSFIDDPTRMFRAARYAARIQGQIESDTLELLKIAIRSGALSSISDFRKFSELKHILAESAPHVVLELLRDIGVLEYFPITEWGNGEVFRLLARLSATKRRIIRSERDSLCYGVGLRIFFLCSAASAREERYKKFGFGKKVLKKMSQDIEGVTPDQNLSSLSKEGIVLACIYGISGAEQEAIRRGVFEC